MSAAAQGGAAAARGAINLLSLERAALAAQLTALGEKPYRARQLLSRLHKDGGVRDFSDDLAGVFADFPQTRREQLAAHFTADELPPASARAAADGTHKLLFDAGGGQQIEAVIIPESRRMTLCVSSQVGCALACRFCLTGMQGFARNLSAAEIVSQLRAANRYLHAGGGGRITNIVMMGMGEPLLNADAVLPALELFTDELAYALPPRRVTVSTAGVAPAMARLAAGAPVSLAVSLHAADNALRDELMPINRKYPLEALLAACRRHIENRPRAHITFEYVMLKGINDTPACARALARLAGGLRCKINLIPFNAFAGAAYQCSAPETIDAFRARLRRSNLVVTLRKTRGDDILAACGQLAGEVRARTMGLGAAPPPQAVAPLIRH